MSRIELAPLTLEEGIELASAIDPGMDPAHARELWGNAQGSPFWLEALVRAGGASSGLTELLTVRMRGATSDASAVLALLAVVGRPVIPPGVAGILDWPGHRVEASLTELISRGVAVEMGGAVRLTHDLIREAALTGLSEEARQDLHRRLAERLEIDAGDDLRLLREALQHREAAGMATLDLAMRIARLPRRTLLGEEGLRLLASIADESDPLDTELLDLHEAVAWLATELGEHEEALARWSLVAERAVTPLARASSLLAASSEAFALRRASEASELLARSREMDATDEVLLLEQRTHEAAIRLWLEQRTTEGRALAREALTEATRLATRSGGPSMLGPHARRAYLEALRLDYEATLLAGDYAALLTTAEAREAAARGFELEAYLTASLALGVALRNNGRVREGVARIRRVWGDAHRQVLPKLTVEAGFQLARALELLGDDLVEAERVILETRELADRVGDVPRARYPLGKVACGIALLRGAPRDGLLRLERVTAEEPNGHLRIALHQDVALWNARLDGPAAAAIVDEQLAAAHACAEKAGCARCSAELLLNSAEALARVGERDAARQALTRWKTSVASPDSLDDIIWLHARALAEVDQSDRVAGLEGALAAAEASPYHLESLWVRLDLGWAMAGDKRDRAVAELKRTAEEACERGAGTVQELAEQALRKLGVRTWRRGVAGAPLTGREQEVAGLVAGGATNREIATALFLSPKTVERHVSNALKKLGARNRTELASRLRDGEAEHAGNAR